jgi:hypothetical protein
MSPRVVLVSPVPLDSPRGNAITVARIAQGLRTRGLDVSVQRPDDHGLAEPAPGQPPALVHAFHAYRGGPPSLALAKICRAPLVITLTGTDVSDDLRDSARGQVVRETLLGAAAITTFHDSIAEEIAAALPAVASRLAVVPQSVSLPPASGGGEGPLVHGEPCLLFPAGIRPVKRPLLPLASLDGLLHRHPGLRLWYAGPALDPQETGRLVVVTSPTLEPASVHVLDTTALAGILLFTDRGRAYRALVLRQHRPKRAADLRGGADTAARLGRGRSNPCRTGWWCSRSMTLWRRTTRSCDRS